MNEPASAFVQILKQLVQLLGLCLGAPYLHFNGFCHNWWAVLLLFENSVLIFSTATQIESSWEWFVALMNDGFCRLQIKESTKRSFMGLPVSPRHFCWIGDLSKKNLNAATSFSSFTGCKVSSCRSGNRSERPFPHTPFLVCKLRFRGWRLSILNCLQNDVFGHWRGFF